jgi:hypothetical protein
MGMKCGCGGEIDLTTGCCKECQTQNFTLRGNASIRMREQNEDVIEIIFRKDRPCRSDRVSAHYNLEGPTIEFK